MSKIHQKINQLLSETVIDEAVPTDHLKSKTYYHGTSSTIAAESILAQGLRGQLAQSKRHMAPVVGKVYITPSLPYAIIYALRGDFSSLMLEDMSHEKDPYGYVFVIKGSDLIDVQPDEDSIGEWFSENTEPIEQPFKKPDGTVAMKPDGTPYMKTVGYKCAIPDTDTKGKEIYYFIKKNLTENQYNKILKGEYNYFASGGKRVLKNMPDNYKIELINRGAHIAHGGEIMPSECWKIQKNRLKELKKDGSNFFEIAEKIN